MKLWELESALQDVAGFQDPKVTLEQYETPAHIAANMLFMANSSFNSIYGQCIADLGCGCGMLSIGASKLGAAHVTGFDIDEDALEVCKLNLDEAEITDVDLVLLDVLQLGKHWRGRFDTVLLNPPFGTKRNAGIDMQFLKVAVDLSSERVFSLHKSSTRNFVLRKAKSWGIEAKVLAQLKYNLPQSLKFHKKNSVDIQVDFIMFSHTEKRREIASDR